MARPFTQRLRGLSAAIKRDVARIMEVAAQKILVEAQISITEGAVSGRNHVPSTPGQPPNADTHFLANNIRTHRRAPLDVDIVSEAPYSTDLENGTSKMQARPFMRPAIEKKRREVADFLQAAAMEAIRRHLRSSGQ